MSAKLNLMYAKKRAIQKTCKSAISDLLFGLGLVDEGIEPQVTPFLDMISKPLPKTRMN